MKMIFAVTVKESEDGDYFYLREYQNKFCHNCGAKMDILRSVL